MHSTVEDILSGKLTFEDNCSVVFVVFLLLLMIVSHLVPTKGFTRGPLQRLLAHSCNYETVFVMFGNLCFHSSGGT